MEECDRRSVICDAPIARGIRGMDKRAKGCAECCFLFSYAGSVQPLCALSFRDALSNGRCPVRRGAHVQANAGKRPDRPSSSRLLATRSFWRILLNQRKD